MSPIFIRPVREQLEHDRLIRHLQAKYKRKSNEVGINPGEEQGAPVKLGANTFFPDLVTTEAGKLSGLVEVESGESVNNLEAMAQWVHFAKARVPFHLYVPVEFYDAAKRLADAREVKIAEIWTYRGLLDGFDLVRMHHDPSVGGSKSSPPAPSSMGRSATAKPEPPVAKSAAKTAPKPAAKPIAAKAAKAAVKPAAKALVRKATVKPAAKVTRATDRSKKAPAARKR